MQSTFPDVVERLMARFGDQIALGRIVRVAFEARESIDTQGLGWQPDAVEALADRLLTAVVEEQR
jgi:hypothetical protein